MIPRTEPIQATALIHLAETSGAEAYSRSTVVAKSSFDVAFTIWLYREL